MIIHSVHKPLEIVLKNPLSQAAKWLQALVMHLYRNDIEIKYVPGSALAIADTFGKVCPEVNEMQSCVANFLLEPLTEVIPDETKCF